MKRILGIALLCLFAAGARADSTNYGYALSFSNATDICNASVSVPSIGTADFTLSAWVKSTNNTAKGSIVMEIGAASSAASAGFYLDGTPNLQFSFYGRSPPNVPSVAGSTIFGAGQGWHLLVGTATNGYCTLWVDAVPQSSVAVSYNLGTALMTVGGITRASGYNFLGEIDQPTIWTRGLSGAEITNLYASGLGLQNDQPNYPTNAVRGWEFNDGSGTVVVPWVGASTGTLSGCAWVTGHVPIPATTTARRQMSAGNIIRMRMRP